MLWQSRHMADRRPTVVTVLGPWSSGTSAVAGIVAVLGAEAHAPFVRVNDPQTPRSFESLALRKIIEACFDHAGLQRRDVPPGLVAHLRRWAGDAPLSVAKMPALCFFIEEVLQAWEPLFIVVTRPVEAIEASRVRRGWPAEYGARGADVIYPLIEAGVPRNAQRLDVDYERLKAEPEMVGAEIARFCGLPGAPQRVRYVLTRGRAGQAPPASSSG